MPSHDRGCDCGECAAFYAGRLMRGPVKRNLLPFILGLFVLARLVMYLWHPHCAEDAFITFRASRNLLLTGHPVFNPGESSWPASSPLWAIWCALGLFAAVDIEWWARLGSLVAECALIAAVWRMAGTHHTQHHDTRVRVSICFTILLAAFQPAIAISLSGIEMYAMCAAFAWVLLGNRWAMALLILSRPEGIALGLIGLARTTTGRRAIAPAVLGLMGWGLFAFLCWRWMPAGVTAKLGAYGIHWLSGGVWLGLFWPFGITSEQWSLGVIGLSAIVLARWFHVERLSFTFIATGLALLLAYYVSGAVYFSWYQTLPMLACMLLVACVAGRWRLGWLLAVAVAACSWSNDYLVRRWDVQYEGFSRLAATIPNSGTAIMDPVGVIGWLKPDLRIIDLIGLTSPLAEDERRRGDGWLGRLIRAEQPTSIMLNRREMDSNQPDAGAGALFLPGDEFPEYVEHATSSRGHVVLVRAK